MQAQEPPLIAARGVVQCLHDGTLLSPQSKRFLKRSVPSFLYACLRCREVAWLTMLVSHTHGLRVTGCDSSHGQGFFFTIEPCLSFQNRPCRRRRIHARSADVSANDPSMRSPGRHIGAAPINCAPTSPSSLMWRRRTSLAPARKGRHCISHLVCHPERSEGSLPSGRSFAALRMTTLFIDQTKVDCALRCITDSSTA